MQDLILKLKQLDIHNVDNVVDKFESFYNMLIEANTITNLTTITDKQEVFVKHFIDSIIGYPYIKDNILDIGAGAGFPAIPLAIINDTKKFTLVDSVNKKVDFIKTVISNLNLNNVTAFHSRIEDMDKTTKYNTIVSRGVGELNIITEYCLPFLEIGGVMVAYKSTKAQEEITNCKNALQILGGEIQDIHNYTFKCGQENLTRNIIIIKKVKECSDKYPRGANKPRKKPL